MQHCKTMKKYHFKLLLRNLKLMKVLNSKKITWDHALMEDHKTPNMDSLKKEESNLNQIMDTAEKNKKEKKIATTFNLKRKYDKVKRKIP